jgi:hypothetical protein
MVETPSVENLKAWKQIVEEEVAAIANKIQPLQEALAAAKERLDLIVRLLQLADRPARSSDHSLQRDAEGGFESDIHRILNNAGQPLHIREIRSRLIADGVRLPGKGTEANIIVRMRRASDAFRRVERGVYGLATWTDTDIVARAPRKRRKRRKTTRKRISSSKAAPS